MRPLLAVVALAVVAAGCADGESNPSVTTGGGATPTVAPTTTQPSAVTTSESRPPTTASAPPTTAATGTTTTISVPLLRLDELQLELTEVADGFDQPVFLTSAPGDDRLFVVDQPGRIWIIDGSQIEVFLDVSDRVVFGGEQGLLGLAFPPDYADSGVFYVNYVGRSNNGAETRISAFSGIESADADSEQVLLRIDQPAANHNGGMIAFGPDGFLWIGMGDGGARDDRFGHGQRPDTLLGAMLRIDVRSDGYEIPPDNPASGEPGYAPEVWATGLRNPWRFAFDGEDVWIADVGQNALEEVNQVSAAIPAVNYGWPLFEGTRCYLSNCDDSGLTAPVTEYGHGEGCSVTGGVVYRGSAIPELDGHYLFGDFCGGWIRSFDASGTTHELFPPGTVGGLASFGADEAGEVYVISTNGGIFRIDRS